MTTNRRLRFLVFDISNVLFRTYYANKNEDELTIAGLAQHAALITLNSYFKKYRPDKVVMVFDRPNWRVDYTKSDECYSGRIYKGNRHSDKTAAEKKKYNDFKAHLVEFEQLIIISML